MRGARRAENGWGLTLWGVGYILVGVVLACVTAWPIYESTRMLVVAAAAAVLGLGIMLAAKRFRLRVGTTTLLATLAYLFVVAPVAIPSAMTSPLAVLRGIRDGIVGIVVGWKQLLTLNLPLGEYQAVLVPFLIVIFLGCIVAMVFVDAKGAFAPVAVVVMVAMVAFGIVFGSSHTSQTVSVLGIDIPAPREIGIGVLTLVASMVWLSGRSRLIRLRALKAARATSGTVRQGTASIWPAVRRNALAAALVAVALVAGFAAAPATADLGPRHALRDRIDPLLVVQQQPSPLSDYRAWFTSANLTTPLFTLSGDISGITRLRLAVLDSYDGEDFHVSDSDDISGRFSRLPRTTPTTKKAQRVAVTIDSGYSGIWVPVPPSIAAAPIFAGEQGAELSDNFFVSDANSTAITVRKNSDGSYGLNAGDSYTVPATATSVSDATLAAASADKSLLNLDDYPSLAQWVELQKVPRTGAGLEELFTRLSARGYLSHSLTDGAEASKWIESLGSQANYVFQSSYSGHSVARIETLFDSLITQQKQAGPKAAPKALISAVGDDEQFSVAAALLARYFGFDSRVVVGVRLAGDTADTSVAPCKSVCTGANMAAWVQVHTPGGKWVPFDVSPQFEHHPIDIALGEQLPENPTVPDEEHSKTLDPPAAKADNSDEQNTATADNAQSWALLWAILRIVALSVCALLFVLLPVIVLCVAKAVRRRSRQRSLTSETRVVAAWEELLDLYIDNGIVFDSGATRSQLATDTGRPAAMKLAGLVDRAVFSEHLPSEDVGATAWELVTLERRDLASSKTLLQRIRATLTPASFVRRDSYPLPFATATTVFRKKETVQ